MKRREFLKYGMGGLAALVVGPRIPGISDAFGAVQVQTLNFHITDCIKSMATDNPLNPAKCYYWCFYEDHIPPDCPGPTVFVSQGTTVQLTVFNDLDEPHAFFIPGIINTGPIAPRQSVVKQFTITAPAKGAALAAGDSASAAAVTRTRTRVPPRRVPPRRVPPSRPGTSTVPTVAAPAGTYLYYDNLNDPVNRVMGLHGAFVVMPANYAAGTPTQRVTPYGYATPNVQKLFNDLGTAPWWPGLAWEQWDAYTYTPACRQWIWILHQASPNLFAEVGDWPAGQVYPAAQFVQKFLHDEFQASKPATNNIPQYFTISGQSGHFSHNTPYICPNCRVGEPGMIRILNAGLWTHSMHIHANHVYVTSINGVVQENPFWVDVFTLNPMDRVDWLVPYMRPPDIPNSLGNGRCDLSEPLTTLNGGTTWPPNDELGISLPSNLFAGDGSSLSVELSPLCYPMHDHSEPSQSSQGGNYNMGMISGLNFTGDRNHPSGCLSFPNQPMVYGPGSQNYQYASGCYPAAVPPPWFAKG